MMVEIAAMTRDHLDEVIALWNSAEGLILSDADHPELLTRYLERNSGFSQVALIDGRVVGAVLCGHDGRRGYLYHLAVATEHRQQGIGSTLVNASLAALKRAGYSRCNLFVIDDNAAGRQFWTRTGWSEWPQIRLVSKECC